jgi:predicted dehydrogenase
VEVHWDGTSATIDDFRSWTLHSGARSATRRARGQDKGHRAEVDAFVAFALGQTSNPVPFHQSAHVTEVTFAIVTSLRTRSTVELPSTEPWG